MHEPLLAGEELNKAAEGVYAYNTAILVDFAHLWVWNTTRERARDATAVQ